MKSRSIYYIMEIIKHKDFRRRATVNFQNLILFSIIIPLVVSLITIIGFYLYYRKKPKVDKGFKFAYYALSYRRKFWRTVYSIPICILSIAIIYLTLGFSSLFIFLTLFITISLIIQASYNYVMWQKEKQSHDVPF